MKKIFFLFSIFLSLFTVFSFFFINPNLKNLSKIYSDFAFSQRFPTTIIYVLSILIFYIFYTISIHFISKKKLSLTDLTVFLATTCIILLISYPAMLSYDIFNYIATSRVIYFYQENPYIVMPIEFSGDFMLGFMHAANKTALYGPVWILLTAVPYFLGFGNFIATLFSFKLFILIFYLLTIVLIWKFSDNLRALALFALNPLVAIESLVSSHNDIIMIFLALLSLYLLKKNKFFFSCLLLLLSILIKYATIFLIPVYLYVLINTLKNKELRWNKIFTFSAISMFLIFLLSVFREEIYPWYAIWFLPFAFLSDNKKLIYLSISLSLGLLLRYIPYMLFGTHSGSTPFFKEMLTFVPLFLTITYFEGRKIYKKVRMLFC